MFNSSEFENVPLLKANSDNWQKMVRVSGILKHRNVENLDLPTIVENLNNVSSHDLDTILELVELLDVTALFVSSISAHDRGDTSLRDCVVISPSGLDIVFSRRRGGSFSFNSYHYVLSMVRELAHYTTCRHLLWQSLPCLRTIGSNYMSVSWGWSIEGSIFYDFIQRSGLALILNTPVTVAEVTDDMTSFTQ